MADITMCQGISSDNIGCDKREQCLVIVVNDSGWSQECDYFKSNV